MTTVIRGGTVVDGTGSPPFVADVSLADGRIVEIGAVLNGDEVIEATGAVVAPGFIDIHTHYDAQVFWDPALTPSCFHGVTTVIAGNCGFSIAPTRPADRDRLVRTMQQVEDMDPATLTEGVDWSFETFPEYLAAVESRGTVVNYGAMIGHTPLRMYVLGEAASEREATDDEIARMAEHVAEAMGAGAMGFATSYGIAHRDGDGNPIPSRFADRREVVELGRVVGEHGRGVVAVNAGKGLNFRDVYEIQSDVGAPITITALLTLADGLHHKLLEIHREGWSAGKRVHPQVSCRPLTFSMTLVEPFTLNTNPRFAELMGKPLDDRRAAFADPGWRRQTLDAWNEGRPGAFAPRWDTYEIMESEAHPELVGRRLVDIAAERGAAPFDALLDLALNEPLLAMRFKVIVANDAVDDIAMLLHEDGCVVGLSDAAAHVGQLCDAPLPTDLLGNWVRERQAITLSEAVRKLTSEPAALFGLADRGVLRPGAHADIVVFDPATVAPGPLRRVRDFPANGERLTADEVPGMHRVIVGGTTIVADGALTDEAVTRRPGGLVRPE